MNGINKLGVPVITGKPFAEHSGTVKQQAGAGQSFQDLLAQRLGQNSPGTPLTFSKHAQARTEQRGISLSQADMERLGGAVDKAQGKGLNDTLVFMNNTAFIVNVPNKVVVTVVDGSEAGSTVFTNIDGAVIV